MYYFYEGGDNLVHPRIQLLFVHPGEYFRCQSSVHRATKLKNKWEKQKKAVSKAKEKEGALVIQLNQARRINSDFEYEERIERSFLY